MINLCFAGWSSYGFVAFAPSSWVPAARMAVTVSCIALAVCLFAFCVALAVAIHFWRKNRKTQQSLSRAVAMLDAQPLRSYVADATGRILAFHDGASNEIEEDSTGRIQDLPDIGTNEDAILSHVYETVSTGVERTAIFGKEKRVFTKLPVDLFQTPSVLVSRMDISAESRLRKEEQRIKRERDLLEANLPVGVLDFGEDGALRRINRVAELLLGVSGEAVRGILCDRLFTYPDMAETDPVRTVLKTHKPLRVDTPVMLTLYNSQTVFVSYRAVPISVPGHTDAYDGVLLVLSDETERMTCQAEITRNTRTAQMMMDLSQTGTFSLNTLTHEYRASTGFEHLWPSRNGELMPIEEWVCPEDRDAFSAGHEALVSGKHEHWTFEFRSVYFGVMSYYRINCERRVARDGAVWLSGAIQDVSEMKRPMVRNAKAAALVESLIHAMPCPFFGVNISDEYRFTLASDACYPVFGVTKSALVGRRMEDVCGGREFFGQLLRIARQANITSGFVDEHIWCEEATRGIRYYHVIVKTESITGGDKTLFGICLDETDAETARSTMENQRGFYLEIINCLPVSLYVKDVESRRYEIWNQAVAEQTGVAASQILGQTDAEVDVFVPVRERIHEAEDRILATGEPISNVYEMTNADGRMVCYRARHVPVRYGERKYFVTWAQDITHERAVEAARTDIVNRLNTRITNASLVNACLKRLTREPNFDHAVFEMLQTLGVNTHVDRCYLYRYSPDMKTARCEYEWVREGITPQKDMHQAIDATPFEPWTRQLLDRQIIRVDNVNDDSDALIVSYRDLLRAQQIQSLLVFGIYDKETLCGFLGIDCVRRARHFEEADIALLNDIVSIFQLAWQRAKFIQDIEENTVIQNTILDSMRMPVVLLNMDFTVARVNNAAKALLEVSDVSVVEKRPCYEVCCKNASPPPYCAMQKILTGQRTGPYDVTIHDRSYTISHVPIFRKGRLFQVLETFVDMTDAMRSRDLLKKAAADAESAARAKSMFLATMSHELRTPLNAVIGFAELLNLGGMTEDAHRDAVRSIYLAGTTLLTLINDVLDFSKLEAGKMTLVPTPTDPREIIDELQAVFTQQFRQKNLTAVFEVSSQVPVVNIDGLRLRQILMNLVGNALKFTSVGGVTLSAAFVRTEKEKDVGDLTIAVKDTGIGIDPENVKKVFEPFVQDTTRQGAKRRMGTGLGLPICKSLAERMNGTLDVQSIPGKGSCFTVHLPHLTVCKDAPASRSSASFVCPSCSGRILLVDDVPMNLKMLESMAAKLGIKTRSAANGQAALKIIDEFKPDAVFTDLWMPEMDGTRLAREIRANPAWSAIKIFLVSADTEVAQKDLVHNFDGILMKPITLAALASVAKSIQGGGGASS